MLFGARNGELALQPSIDINYLEGAEASGKGIELRHGPSPWPTGRDSGLSRAWGENTTTGPPVPLTMIEGHPVVGIRRKQQSGLSLSPAGMDSEGSQWGCSMRLGAMNLKRYVCMCACLRLFKF